MVIFHSFLYVYQRVSKMSISIYPINSWLSTFFCWLSIWRLPKSWGYPQLSSTFSKLDSPRNSMWTTNYKVDNKLLIGYIDIYIYSYWIINYKLNYILITSQLLMNWIYTSYLHNQLRKTL
jgi:hypothetical protein